MGHAGAGWRSAARSRILHSGRTNLALRWPPHPRPAGLSAMPAPVPLFARRWRRGGRLSSRLLHDLQRRTALACCVCDPGAPPAASLGARLLPCVAAPASCLLLPLLHASEASQQRPCPTLNSLQTATPAATQAASGRLRGASTCCSTSRRRTTSACAACACRCAIVGPGAPRRCLACFACWRCLHCAAPPRLPPFQQAQCKGLLAPPGPPSALSQEGRLFPLELEAFPSFEALQVGRQGLGLGGPRASGSGWFACAVARRRPAPLGRDAWAHATACAPACDAARLARTLAGADPLPRCRCTRARRTHTAVSAAAPSMTMTVRAWQRHAGHACS